MKIRLEIATLALLFSTVAVAQISSAQIDSIFSSLKSDSTPGAAVVVIRDGKPVFRGGYGVTDLRTMHRIDTQTNFRLASFTKQFTAMCIMLLVHDGKLQYDEHLTDIFPEFPHYGRSIKVRNLLNHTSGLPDYEDLWTAKHPGIPEENIPQIHDAEVLKILEQQSAGKFAPGSHWEYSNSGYVVLGLIVEKASGKPFGEFLRERIFVPLKMNDTVAHENGKNEVLHRAYGHTKEKDGWHETDQSPPRSAMAAFILRLMTWPNGTVHSVSTRC